MKNKFALMIGMLLIMILPMIAASPGTYQQYQPIQLTQTCDNGAAICDACNISYIKSPASVIIISNVVMSKRVSDFNYTLSAVYTNYLGTYSVAGVCTKGAEVKTWTYNFKVVSTPGAENNTTTFLVLAIAAIILLLLAFLLKNHIFSFLSGLLFMGTGVYGMIYGFGSITNVYTQIVSYVIIGLGVIITIISSLEFLSELEGGGNNYSVGEEE